MPNEYSPEFIKKIQEFEKKQPVNRQLQYLSDIADMVQELLSVADSTKKDNASTLKQIGMVLDDSRKQLMAIKDKKDPEAPDFGSLIQAVDNAKTAISQEVAKIDIKPLVNITAPNVDIPAPNVNVAAPKIDLSKIDKAITSVPVAFAKAIKDIPQPQIPDYSELLEEIRDWLKSIDHTSRKKPLPGTMRVTNSDGTPISINSIIPSRYDYIGFTYTGDRLDQLQFKYLGNLVSTIALGYTGTNLTSLNIT